MRLVPAMVDLKRTPAEKTEAYEYQLPTPANQPDYPYGLSISLCEEELDKLNLGDCEFMPGDMIHMHCMAVVTSVSSNNSESSGPTCRIELQITHISAESEDDENEEEDSEEDKSSTPTKISKLYR